MLTESEILTIAKNVGISEDYVRDTFFHQIRTEIDPKLCLVYKSKQLSKLSTTMKTKLAFGQTQLSHLNSLLIRNTK